MLVGLVFVGLELRQNTEAVEAATFQGLTDASSAYLLTIASDPELARISFTDSTDATELNELDSARKFMLERSYWVRMQNVFSQWKRGTLSEDDWLLYENIICGSGEGLNSNDGTQKAFDNHRRILSTEFREYLGACWSD